MAHSLHLARRLGLALIMAAAATGAFAGTPEMTTSSPEPSFATRYPSYYSAYSCDSCHTTVPALNSYGTSYKTAVSALTGGRTVQANVATALANIENLDSDGDSYRNIVEINAIKKAYDATVHPNAAVALSASSAASGGAPGNTVTYTVTLTNSGDLTDSFTLGATVSSGQAWTTTVSGSATNVAAGATATFTVNVAIPASATIGQSSLANVTAVSQANPGVSATPLPITTTASNAAPVATASPTSIDFGGQSMATTSPPRTVTVTNTGNATLTISAVTVSNPQFAQTNTCSSLAPAATCTITVRFSPAVAAGALNSTVSVSGTLSIASNSSATPNTVSLAGTAEKSLVTHYYRSILRRDPDAGGKTFWQDEAVRLQGLGVNVNETWYSMAMQFYGSGEYIAFNRDNTAFVTDLYNTFFNRAPDSAGLTYWLGQMSSGMPRDGVLVNFMFSAEFASFTQAVFGTSTVRSEIDMIMDFYRGLLARTPDTAGFNFYLGRFRTAQCQGANAVYTEVESISSFFANSPEYGSRGRTSAQYVSDLFNAFMRRGPDLSGMNYWVGQIDTGARTRENVRQAFRDSAEFSARVQRVIGESCMP